jgi:hypothetical protein
MCVEAHPTPEVAMKMTVGFALLLAACLLCAGCVVRSIQPWLSDESRVKDPSLIGAWHDVKNQSVAFFSESASSDCDYNILWVQNGKDLSRFTASLHRIDDTLLLVVGPDDPENLNGCVLLPGHLLLKAAPDGDALRLYGIDLDSFEARASKASVGLLPGGSVNDGFTLGGSTADVEAFARAQLADPEFFDPEPLYSFQKLPAPAP